RENGLSANDIRSTADLTKLPFTSKKDLGEPRDFVLIPDEKILKIQPATLLKTLRYGPRGAQRELARELRPIFMTSTTGRSAEPVPFLYTQHDLDNLQAGGRRLFQVTDSPADYRVINLFPFAPHLAFWQAHYASIGSNTFTLSTGGGKTMGTDGNAKLLAKIDPDALIAMPTFLYHLLQHAAGEGLRATKLKRLVLGGEKVPQGMRQKLRDLCATLGSPDARIVSTYGFTEAKFAWGECPVGPDEQPTGFHLYPDFSFIEIIDPDTGRRVSHGQPGEIVLTPLDARGTVVLRYRTGDLIEGGLTYEACPNCGRTCPRLLGRISRVSDIHRLHIDKLNGTLVDFNTLEHLLDDTPGLGAWQIELRKKNDDPMETDQIIIHAVALNGHQAEKLTALIRRRLREGTELSPNDIHFHSWEEMRDLHGVGQELKEKKVIDHRPSGKT
ncbi:MAG: phenylacetate--CoA ligase family protein, partial [Verrucomicrobiales bacterium]